MAQNKNIIVRIQNWIESETGQTFLNYAYSWGAAVVILGALFKLTHIPGANAMLFVGMGTEVFVFFISGFDRSTIVHTNSAIEEDIEEEEDNDKEEEEEMLIKHPQQAFVQQPQPSFTQQPEVTGYEQPVAPQGQQPQQAYIQQPAPAIDMEALTDMINKMNAQFVEQAREACAPGMQEAAMAYVEELKALTETLTRVSAQAENMTRDSKEMENLNRTLTGINTIYEMQLKSISTQVGTIDQINEQTRKMAHQIEDLNAIYNRMIQALTVNMNSPLGGNGSTLR